MKYYGQEFPVSYYEQEFPEHLITNFFYDISTLESVLRSEKQIERYKQAAKNAGIEIYIKDNAYDFSGGLVSESKALWCHAAKDKSKFWRELDKLGDE